MDEPLKQEDTSNEDVSIEEGVSVEASPASEEGNDEGVALGDEPVVV